MKINLISFLFFITVFIGVISCKHQNDKTLQKSVASNYINSLYLEADSLKKDRSIEEALRVNKRALKLIHSGSDSIMIDIIKQRISLFRKIQNKDSVIIYAQKLFEIQENRKDSSGIADAYFRLGYYYRDYKDIENALVNYYNSINIYKSLGDSMNVGKKSVNLSNLLNEAGNYNEAETMAVNALIALEEKSNKKYISGAYNAIAIATKQQELYKEALYWYDKAIESAKGPNEVNAITNNKAVVYLKQEKYQEAFSLLSSVINDTTLNKPKYISSKARSIDNWAFTKSKLGHKDAEQFLREALELRKQKDDPFELNASYIHLAEHYADRNNPKALKMAQMALSTAKVYKNADDELNALAMLIEISNNPKEYALAYQHLSDSINKVRERVKSSYAKVKYDVEYNRQENERLKGEAQIQSLEMSRAKFRNIILILLLLIVFGVGYWRYRWIKNKHHREKEKTAYDAELKISKRVHDEVANDVFNVLTLVQNQSISAKIKDKLENALDAIYSKTRNISREYNDIETGINFPENLKTLLANYNNQKVSVISKGIDNINWNSLEEVKKRVIYRSLQELMVNMKKHSKATLAVVNFQNGNKQLHLGYSDNGIGIDKEGLKLKGGLQNMENRIEAVKGKVTFETSLNSGFKAMINIPM
ncbi:ATP-binding protein [Galbibacter sp. EGI 63066]|uniref:tetratricopeptide repeat-containing sensor histidine kinase n=1 Tax=Galbibacter sp. EGI 63066 TaxID=2993559 RepID=UPI002248BD3D|nr:tetratricopeptide repeat-containing sensor histidine kinase [Galbibacter sp. EGI 63066]MCX2681768.1 ATP-binding protein [Galbibacter sp. EGI 63066]